MIIPNNVKEIGASAFSRCYELTSISLPDGITRIEDSTFRACQRIKNFTIPASVTYIGEMAFQDCASLTTLRVQSTEITACSNSFEHIDMQTCTLYVPKDAVEKFRNAEAWKDFENIKEYGTTGIDGMLDTGDIKESPRYDLNGRKHSLPIRGINIIRSSDGTTKKIFVGK